MNIGIIGLGKIAEYHIKAINQAGMNIVGGTDLDEGKASILPKGAKFSTRTEDLLTNPEIDTILLLVPGGEMKFNLSKICLEAGKNLLSEKPTVRNLNELRVLVNSAESRGVLLHGIFHSMYSPTCREIAKTIEEKELEIASIEIWAHSPHIDIENKKINSKSSEDTSWHAEGPNILAELSLYLKDLPITIENTDFVSFSSDLPEVQTSFVAEADGIKIKGETSWIKEIKEKGVRIITKDNQTLSAIHTAQIARLNTRVIDFKRINPHISRMQKEYNSFYAEFENISNQKTIEFVTEAMEEVENQNLIDYSHLNAY